MSSRTALCVGSVLLISGAAALSAQGRNAPRDPTAETRLKLARQGYESVRARIADTRFSDVLDEVPVWSLRIMEAQRDTSGDAVGAAREHLARMKDYAKLVEDWHKAGQALDSVAIEGKFREAEAEFLVLKAGAR